MIITLRQWACWIAEVTLALAGDADMEATADMDGYQEHHHGEVHVNQDDTGQEHDEPP